MTRFVLRLALIGAAALPLAACFSSYREVPTTPVQQPVVVSPAPATTVTPGSTVVVQPRPAY